jgi:hypothetical protein
MSIGKLSEAANLGEDFEGLTPEQIKEKILSQFHVTYGRYENVSGTMFFEMCHAPNPDQSGMVHWRKGIKSEITEDEIIDRETAIKRFIVAQQKGYQRTIEALTEEDLTRERSRMESNRSSLDREGLLTTFHKGKEFIRIKEYSKGLYSIERGYNGSVIEATHNQTETSVRAELDFAKDDGFFKEGEEEDEGFTANPLRFFGAETPNREEPKEKEPEVREGGFNPKWLGE